MPVPIATLITYLGHSDSVRHGHPSRHVLPSHRGHGRGHHAHHGLPPLPLRLVGMVNGLIASVITIGTQQQHGPRQQHHGLTQQ